ncbi:MAG: hypothetical protein WA821_12465 [Anaerolineales bacterium]
MQSVTLHTYVGKDGILKLETPIGIQDAELEVLLVVNLVKKKRAARPQKAKGWPPGFFTDVVGGWQGEPLVREPQGEYEIRNELK